MGGAVSGVAGIAVILVAGWFLLRRRFLGGKKLESIESNHGAVFEKKITNQAPDMYEANYEATRHELVGDRAASSKATELP